MSGTCSCSPPCLNLLYDRRVLALVSSPIYGDENTISGLAVLAVLLAWCSCVGRRSPRLSVRGSPRRSSFVPTPSSWDGVVIIGSSLAAACLSCLSPRFAVPVRRRSRFALLQDGQGDAASAFRRRGRGVPIGFSSACGSGLVLLAPSYPYRRGGGCDAALACGRTGWRAWSALLLGDVAVVPSFLLIAPLLLSPHHDVLFFFSFLLSISPDPLVGGSLLLACLPHMVPPPPGRGMCERVIDLRLRAGRRFACFLSCRAALLLSLVRFRLACCSGLPLVSRFSSLPGSGLVRLRRVPSVSPCAFSSRAFLASLLLSAPSHLSGSVGSSSFACPSPLLGDSVAVSCHPIGVPPCFAPSASAFRRSLSARLVSSSRSSLSRRPPPPPPRLSVCLLRQSRSRGVSCRSRPYGPRTVSLRFAHHPALLVVGRGGLLCRSSWSLFLGANRLAPCPRLPCLLSPRYRAGWRRLSGACLVARACLLRVACLPRPGLVR